MAFDAFLLLDGIKGESNDAKHKGEIDVRSSYRRESHRPGLGTRAWARAPGRRTSRT